MTEKADKAELQTVDAKVTTLEERLDKLSSDISQVNNKVDLSRTEQAEKQKRATNIVVRGLPESDDVDDGSMVKNMLLDIRFVHDFAIAQSERGCSCKHSTPAF